MVHFSLFLSLLLMSSVDGGTPTTPEASRHATRAMERVSRRHTSTLLPPPYLHLPVFVHSRLPLVEKEQFSPARGTGREAVPELVRRVLLPVRTSSSPASVSGVSVKTSCARKKMLVQVQRGILGLGDLFSQVTLGTCQASKSTEDFLYFEYGLNMCGTKRKIINNQVVYRNTLQYAPPSLHGPVRRAVPFKLPVECHYNRYQYSYKIGYTPKMRMRKVYKPMRNTSEFTLTPRNAQWERLSPSHQHALGTPMYFEAEALSVSQEERLYVHSCYATPEKSHTSAPRFPVVENFGCMVESKESRSRFIPYKPNVVRFTVDAFLFRGMRGQQLYMHCTMSVESSSPTPTAKSCNYNRKTRWVELYGSDSVCTCCDSTCNSAASTASTIISSRRSTVDSKIKSTSNRKMVSSTATRTTTTTAETQTQTSREMTVGRTTLQPEEKTAVFTVKELEWPFGGGGVAVVEVEGEEKQLKGSAVLVVEEGDAEPRIIFEEIFDFDQ